MALYAARQSGAAPVDTRFWPEPVWLDEYDRPVDGSNERAIPTTRTEPELTMEMVREIVEWVKAAPMSSPHKVAVVRLSHVRADGSTWRASGHLCAALLKTLEEPPRWSRFVLLATEDVPVMVRSRCSELTAGLLPVPVLADVLERVSDLSAAESQAVARIGGGRVSTSVAVSTSAAASIRSVVDVLTHLAANDRVALTEKMRLWSDEDTAMLTLWAHEQLTGRGEVFSGSGAPELSRLAAQRVLAAVSGARGARPRLVLGAVAALVEK